MIKLHGFGEYLGVKDTSPCVLKVKTYLQMAGVEYEDKNGLESFKKAPRGLLPFIEDGDEIITDSYFIIEYLKKHYGDLDAHLSSEQKAHSTFIQQSLDSFLYEALLTTRWQGDNWPRIKEAFFSSLPLPSILRRAIAQKTQKKIVCRLNHHMNKYSKEELMYLVDNLFASLSTLLGENNYLFNNKPSSLDAVCFAYLAQFILFEIKNPLSEKAESYPNLVAYCHHMEKEFFT